MSPGAALAKLGEADLRALASTIRSHRLSPPFGISAVQRITGQSMAVAASDAPKGSFVGRMHARWTGFLS